MSDVTTNDTGLNEEYHHSQIENGKYSREVFFQRFGSSAPVRQPFALAWENVSTAHWQKARSSANHAHPKPRVPLLYRRLAHPLLSFVFSLLFISANGCASHSAKHPPHEFGECQRFVNCLPIRLALLEGSLFISFFFCFARKIRHFLFRCELCWRLISETWHFWDGSSSYGEPRVRPLFFLSFVVFGLSRSLCERA